MAALTLLDGIESAHAEKLRQAGIRSPSHLLEHCRTAEGRRALAQRTGFDQQQIDHWVRLADLFRIRGVGAEYAGLLAAAGVGTVYELAGRDPVSLRGEMAARNQDEAIVQCLPSEGRVHHWIEQARRLVRIVGY